MANDTPVTNLTPGDAAQTEINTPVTGWPTQVALPSTAGAPAQSAQPTSPLAEAQAKPVPAPGSFADKLSKGMQELAAQHPDPAKPGAWAQIVMGALPGALSKDATAPAQGKPQPRGVQLVNRIGANLGDIASATEGGPAGGGIAGAFRVARAQSQREVEESKNRVQIALANTQMLHQQALTHQLGTEAMEKSATSGQAAVDTLTHSASPGRVVSQGKTASELAGMIKTAKNPDGTLQPDRQLVFSTGSKQVGTNPDGTPSMVPTFTVIDPGSDVELSKADMDDFKKLGMKEDDIPKTMSPANYNSYRQQFDNWTTHKAVVEDAAQKAGMSEYRLKISKAGADIANDESYLKAADEAKGDPVETLFRLQSEPQFKDYRDRHRDLQNEYISHLGAGNFEEGQKAWDKFVESYEKRQAQLFDKSQAIFHDLDNPTSMDTSDKASAALAVITARLQDPNTLESDKPKLRFYQNQADAAFKATRANEILTEKSKGANAPLDKEDLDSLMPSMLAYNVDPEKLAGMRGSQREQLVAALVRKDPTWSEAEYKERFTTTQDFRPQGSAGKQIQSVNTFAKHAAAANDLISSLQNTKSPWLNKPLNEVKKQFGNDKIGPYSTALEAARDEYLNFLKAGHAPTADEIKRGDDLVNENTSPANAQAILRQMAETAALRAESMNDQYAFTMKKDYPNMLSVRSAQFLKNMGVDVGHVGGIGGQAQQTQPNQTQGSPAASVAPAAKPPNTVHMQRPDGSFMYIPVANQAAAEKLGAKVVQ